MAKAGLAQKEFDKMFEYVKEDILGDKFSKEKVKRLAGFVEHNFSSNPTQFFYLLFKKLAKIDRKIEISIEVSEMYSFATTYCIAKRLGLNEKETNALYDEVDREAKLILEKTVKANEEMKYLSRVLSLKYKENNK